MKLNWNFLGGESGAEQKNLVGEVWKFFGNYTILLQVASSRLLTPIQYCSLLFWLQITSRVNISKVVEQPSLESFSKR